MPTARRAIKSDAVAPKAEVLYVKFKSDTVMTVSRARFDEMTAHFGQDATFITHFALSRLYEDMRRGKLASANDVQISDRAPTEAEWDKLDAWGAASRGGKPYTPTHTLEEAWGLSK